MEIFYKQKDTNIKYPFDFLFYKPKSTAYLPQNKGNTSVTHESLILNNVTLFHTG